MAGKFAKTCAARSGFFFLFISQTCWMLFYFLVSFVVIVGCSSSPVALQCKTTLDMRRCRWKADDLMGKGRRKRRPHLLANRETRIWKQLNLLSWMLAISLTKYYGSFAFKNPRRELELCVQVPHSFAYMQSLIQNCSMGRKLVIFERYITNQ